MTKEIAIKVAEWWNEQQKGLTFPSQAEASENYDDSWVVEISLIEKWLGTTDMRYLITIVDYYGASSIVHMIDGELEVRIY